MKDFATADLSDGQPEAYENCELQLRSFGRARCFYGEIITVQCADDNGLVRALLAEPGHGHVLVVDGGGSLRTALVGDVLARLALERGWSGVVVNGAVRDTAALAMLSLGVLALGTSPRRAASDAVGRQGVPVTFGRSTFVTGQALYADSDGVLVTRA